jgi:hypothetical protein
MKEGERFLRGAYVADGVGPNPLLKRKESEAIVGDVGKTHVPKHFEGVRTIYLTLMYDRTCINSVKSEHEDRVLCSRGEHNYRRGGTFGGHVRT